jgi:hypothetical protein
MEKPTIVLDIGAVAIGLNYSLNENSFFSKASSLAKIPVQDFKDWYSLLEMDCLTGDIDSIKFYDSLRGIFNKPDMSKASLEEMISSLWSGPIESTIKLKQELHDKGYDQGIISNMTDYCLDIIYKKYPEVCETWGGKTVFSFEHGLIKPDLRLYKMFDDVLGLKIFIDDNLNYASAPVKAGLPDWIGINYTEFVDKHEPIRSLQEKTSPTKYLENVYIAHDSNELREVLNNCGVKI